MKKMKMHVDLQGILTLLVGIMLIWLVPAPAEPYTDDEMPNTIVQKLQNKLKQRMDIVNFTNKDAILALRYLADDQGLTIVTSKKVQGKIDEIRLRDVTLEDALDEIAGAVDAKWYVKDEIIFVHVGDELRDTLTQKVKINFKDKDVNDVLRRFSERYELNVILPRPIRGTMSIERYESTLGEMLERIIKTLDMVMCPFGVPCDPKFHLWAWENVNTIVPDQWIQKRDKMPWE